MKSLTEFGDRVVLLCTGAQGLRGGIKSIVKEVAGDEPVLDFIGSDNSIDRYNEVIDQSGWQLDNFKANPVIPDCHNYSSVACILGKAISVGVNDKGQLANRVEFALDNPLGNMAYKMAKGGFIKAQSVGFIPLEWTNGNEKDGPDRTYTKTELLEISLVVVPANQAATNAMEAALVKGVITKTDVRAAFSVMKQFCGEEDPVTTAGASGSEVIYAQLQEHRWLHELWKSV